MPKRPGTVHGYPPPPPPAGETTYATREEAIAAVAGEVVELVVHEHHCRVEVVGVCTCVPEVTRTGASA